MLPVHPAVLSDSGFYKLNFKQKQPDVPPFLPPQWRPEAVKLPRHTYCYMLSTRQALQVKAKAWVSRVVSRIPSTHRDPDGGRGEEEYICWLHGMAVGSGHVALQSSFAPSIVTHDTKFRLTDRKYGCRSVRPPSEPMCVCRIFPQSQTVGPTVKSLPHYFSFSIFLILLPQTLHVGKVTYIFKFNWVDFFFNQGEDSFKPPFKHYSLHFNKQTACLGSQPLVWALPTERMTPLVTSWRSNPAAPTCRSW